MFNSWIGDRPEMFFLTDEPHPLKDGLGFAGLGRFPGGTYYHDSSLPGIPGTLTGTGISYSPQLGRQVIVTGGSGYVNCGTRTDLALTTGWMAVGGWYYGTNADDEYLFANSTKGWNCYANGGTPRRLTFRFGGGGREFDNAMPYNAWTHVAFISNNFYIYCYINGVLFGSNDYGTPWIAPDAAMTIGSTGASYIWHGAYGDFFVYAGGSKTELETKIKAFADPSNVMLRLGGSDLLRYRPSRSRVYFSGGGAPAASSRRRRLFCTGA